MVSVVIVDDENDLVEVLSEFFGLKNIKVLGKGFNGQQAVDLCIKHSPDYLILDLAMPKFDGIYTIEKLQELESTAKIIVISGSSEEKSQFNLVKYKIFGMFTKPVDPIELINLVINSPIH